MTAERTTASERPRIEPLTRLATGGMADIWLARELGAAGLERLVVVKRLLPHLARQRDIVDMFLSEARFVARLVHPNVVQIHDLGEDRDGYFLVMEYVAGCSVRELTIAASRAETALSPEVAVSIVEQACRGAHAAHELTDPSGEPLGLVHRDISPHNLMIAPSGDVKLLDFGIAKATKMAEATHTGTLKGKHGYMAPEQCRAARVDRRCDVFALGIVAWELLTGERLFRRPTEFATMEAIVHGDFELPTAVRPELPAAFDAVLERALAVDVEERWQTADELRRALVAAAEESGIRHSRDALAASLQALLGEKLADRERALRQAKSAGNRADPAVLHDALSQSETSIDRPDLTSESRSEDVATVVQRSVRPPADETPSSEGAHDDPTIVDRARPGDIEDAEPSPEPPSAPRAVSSEDSEEPTTATPSTIPWRSRLLLVVAAAAVALGAPFAFRETAPEVPASATASPAPAGPPLRFAVAPTVEPDVIERELDPFFGWLGAALGRPIELRIADTYEHTGDLLISGEAELGLLPPLLLVTAMAEEPQLKPLAVRLYDGSRASDGYLLVNEGAPFATANDLRGRTICHVDRTSTTGYLLPRIWMREAGLDPDRDVTIVTSGDHLAAMRDLAEGECDAASVYSGAFLSAQGEGIPVGKFRLMAVTGRVPQDVVAAAPNLAEDALERIRRNLLAFDPERDVDAGRVGDVLGITGFAAYDAAEFDLIRKAAEQEGLLER